MDDMDRAQAHAEALREEALSHMRLADDGAPASGDGHCIDCGDEIPPERLAAVPGTSRCTRCEVEHEASLKSQRRRGK